MEFLKSVTTAFLLFIFASTLSAQTFNSMPGHTDTFTNWRVAETEHFLIIFPAHLDGIQYEAAAIAEASHIALSKNLGVVPDYKMRIYFSDMDEIVNGFAVPFKNSYTNIWVNVNRYANTWTGEAKWLRKVLAHELAHLYHFEAIRSPIFPFDNVFATPSLGDWTEGIAQYQTELWDSQRGDRWTRKAIFDNRPSFSDGQSIENRRLRYAAGNSKVRYLTQTYGDSTLAQILAYRDTLFFNQIPVHDFPKGVRHVLDKSLQDFNEEWLKHTSIYYNSLAGYMERVDSLGGKTLPLRNTWYEHVRFSPDTTKIAVLGTPNLNQQTTTLRVIANDSTRSTKILAHGAIMGPVNWSADGKRIIYARTTRNRRGHMANDIFSVDVESGKNQRLTHERRAASPHFAPEENTIAFIGSNGMTDNIYLLNLETGEETALTEFTGDVQLLNFDWNHATNTIAAARFPKNGKRDIFLLDVETRQITPLTTGDFDDRDPVFNADGTAVAYTSLRDHVPNIFLREIENPDMEHRITKQFVGARLMDWMPADSTHQQGRFIAEATETKRRDQIHAFDASRRVTEPAPEIPEAYTLWTTHQAPGWIDKNIAPNPGLIIDNYDYRSFSNLTRAGYIPFPFIFAEEDFGFGLSGVWIEPTGQHFLFATAALSFPNIVDNSFFLISYTNSQLYPDITLSAFKRSFNGRIYGNGIYFEDINGAELNVNLPVYLSDNPFVNSRTGIHFMFTDVSPNFNQSLPDGIAAPEGGRQAEVGLSFQISKMQPHRHNVIHPLDGWGITLKASAGLPLGFTDTEFFKPDVSAFAILPAPGNTRFYVYARGQASLGTPFAQNFTGLTRYDEIVFPLPAEAQGFFTMGANERVRGHRQYIIGERAVFGTVVYRIPFLPSLQTTILGAVRLGRTTIAPFLDAGAVWNTQLEPGNDLQQRFGTGLELKNVISLGGLEILHSIGLAQPLEHFGEDNYEIYYRVRASVVF